MTRSRVIRGSAGFAGIIVALGVAILGSSRQREVGRAAQQAGQKNKAARQPITMSANLIDLEIALGLKDKESSVWDGAIEVSAGRLQSLDVMLPPGQRQARDATGADRKATVNGPHFTVNSRQLAQGIFGPVLRVSLEAPATATVTVKTPRGPFSFKLADLSTTTPQTFLDGQASVVRLESALRLTGPETEDDYPALAKARDGSLWLTYVAYQPGKPLVPERIQAGGFEDLVTSGHGDQILLMRLDGKTWHPPLDVTSEGLDVWRPTVAVDGQGRVVVAWSQQVNGDWEIFYRRYTPGAKEETVGQWSDVVRLTRSPGTDFHVVAATDSAGVVWLAWQAWRKDNFDIMLAALADGHPWQAPRVISTSPANDWSPAIAADSRGNVYVAWDTYDKGNYDVRLYVTGKETKTLEVANSPRFEARPSLVCDANDRVWIAYEEGDEQWGKDYATDEFRKIGFEKNPGFGLYIKRTIKVKCLVDGQLFQPAGDLEQAFGDTLPRNKSLPRLSVDAAGGVWLLLRHHPYPKLAPSEVWNSYALRYDGKHWSGPRRLAHSANLLDNRPALAPFGQGIVAVYSSDNRSGTNNRSQDDLFAAVLLPLGPTHAPELVATAPATGPKVPVVHPDEGADVTRIRDYRIDVGGKKLHLVRGEFHRHTEYSSHRDGDGLLEDSWRYALDAGHLDWMGNGDHDSGFGSEYMWWQIQKVTDLFHNPPHFVAAQTYERSVLYPDGHRNVIMPRRGIRPLPRGDLKGTPEKGTPDTKVLYAYLKHFGGICSSHTSGTNMGTDWRDNNHEVEPVVEIYQGHRHNYEHLGAPRSATKDTQIGGFRPDGVVWTALEKGYRLGFQSSSDHISTHMSYAVVLTDDISRQGIIDGFKKRHSYAATDNLIVDVRSGEHLMGDAFETSKRPALDTFVEGTQPIAKIHVIRDNKYVYSTEPKERRVKLRYTDMDAKEGKTSYYYIRVEQTDGNLAWASPMWITFKP